MQYIVRFGVPEMQELWDELQRRARDGTISAEDAKLRKKIGKTATLISTNPRHPGLHTHEITSLTARYGEKVWESYLENNTPRAGRVFWVYGPGKGEITIIGLEPHPDDKANAYRKITLSATGDAVE